MGKVRVMLWLLSGTLAVTTSCATFGKPAAAVDCDAAATSFAKRSVAPELPAATAQQVETTTIEVAAQRCRQDAWSETTRGCVTKAVGVDLGACFSEAQADALDQALAERVGPLMESLMPLPPSNKPDPAPDAKPATTVIDVVTE